MKNTDSVEKESDHTRIDRFGNKSWYLNGSSILHREDGPAVIFASGDKEWYIHGKLHRLDGPAVEWVGGRRFWYINGQRCSEHEHTEYRAKQMFAKFIEANPSNQYIKEKGDKEMYSQKADGRYHIASMVFEAMAPWNISCPFVFGGFVRDFLAKESFNDIDMCVHNMPTLNGILESLKSKGVIVVNHGQTKSYLTKKGDPFKVHKYTLSFGEHHVPLDAVIGPPNLLKSNMRGDADVNSLAMGGITQRTFVDNLDSNRSIDKIAGMLCVFDWRTENGYVGVEPLRGVFKNITNKVYESSPNMKILRKSKMINKGWHEQLRIDMQAAAEKIAQEQVKIDKEGSIKMTTNENKTTAVTLSFFDMMKSDGSKAAYRVAGTQMTKGTKAALLLALEKQGHGKESVAAFASMLDTPSGEAVVSIVLGLSLTYLPMVSSDPRAQKLAEEFRVAGIAGIGNEAIGFAIANLLPVINQAMSSLPAEVTSSDQKVRVATPSTEQLQAAENEAAAVAPMRATSKV